MIPPRVLLRFVRAFKTTRVFLGAKGLLSRIFMKVSRVVDSIECFLSLTMS